jgi:hypothetical protein
VRYRAAFESVRALLAARSQAEPLLEADEIRTALGGWPSLRTVQRYVEDIRSAGAQRQIVCRSTPDIAGPRLVRSSSCDPTSR